MSRRSLGKISKPSYLPWIAGVVSLIGVGNVISTIYAYKHPQVQTTLRQNQSKTAFLAKNIRRETQTTYPDGKIEKTAIIDLSTVNTMGVSSTVSTSFSTPIITAKQQYGLSVGYDILHQELYYGGSYDLLGPLNIGVETNVKDRLILKGAIRF